MTLELPRFVPRDPGHETPLQDLRIIDFSHFLAGPFATVILADLGAEVIKIEAAGDGDGYRTYPPSLGGESVPFMWGNRGKKSVAIDLKNPAGRRLAMELIANADVVVENFSTGVMQRLGLDYSTVSKIHPGIIYCSVSAYGRSGPYANRFGFDPIVQAESGYISMNGDPEVEPGYRSGSSIMDIGTAMMTANAIQAAWIAKLRTGKGQLVETTMIETGINMLGNFALAYLATGECPTRFGNTQVTAAPVGAFETATGPLYLACANDRTFQRFAREVLEDAALAENPIYATSARRRELQGQLISEIACQLKLQSREMWLTKMQAAGVPGGAIRTVSEAMNGPEIRELGLLSAIPHPTLGTIPNVGLPIHFSDTPLADPVAAPSLGAHTDAVLSEMLGYTAEQLSELRAENIIS